MYKWFSDSATAKPKGEDLRLLEEFIKELEEVQQDNGTNNKPPQEPQPPPPSPATTTNAGTSVLDFVIKMNEQLMASQAQRDNTEAIYAQSHNKLVDTHTVMNDTLNNYVNTAMLILEEVKTLSVSLDKSNLHFSRITEDQMVLMEKIADKLGVPDVPHAAPAAVMPADINDSR
jgi:hypothetical protein